MNISLPNWTSNQYQAAGKHVLSYAAGAVSFAVAFHFLSPSDASSINDNLNHVYNGLMEAAKGVLGLIATATSIYAGLKAGSNASPAKQMQSVVTNLSAPQVTQIANAVVDPTGREKLINAVAEMPEVKGIVADPAVAKNTESSKVVASPNEIKGK